MGRRREHRRSGHAGVHSRRLRPRAAARSDSALLRRGELARQSRTDCSVRSRPCFTRPVWRSRWRCPSLRSWCNPSGSCARRAVSAAFRPRGCAACGGWPYRCWRARSTAHCSWRRAWTPAATGGGSPSGRRRGGWPAAPPSAGLLLMAVGIYGVIDGGSLLGLGLPVLAVAAVLCGVGLAVGGRRTARSRYRPDPWRRAGMDRGGLGPRRADVAMSVAARPRRAGAHRLVLPSGLPEHSPAAGRWGFWSPWCRPSLRRIPVRCRAACARPGPCEPTWRRRRRRRPTASKRTSRACRHDHVRPGVVHLHRGRAADPAPGEPRHPRR